MSSREVAVCHCGGFDRSTIALSLLEAERGNASAANGSLAQHRAKVNLPVRDQAITGTKTIALDSSLTLSYRSPEIGVQKSGGLAPWRAKPNV